jgi:ubiquinone/menaquinone biosynthesis C-methylase UbiE
MSKFTTDDILSLYRSQAEMHGLDGTSTIQDIRTRRLELQALLQYVSDGLKVLEAGCGNGYVAEQFARALDVQLDAFDFSPEMIAVAQSRDLSGDKGNVRFWQQDVLEFEASEEYDLVFSERCIQNLATWDEQKLDLWNLVGALTPNGRYVMLESFWTGLNNLNSAREEIGLDPIPESWHNRFFDESETREFMASLGCSVIEENCFLSGYYFGSRVLLPGLMPAGKEITSKSILNDFFVGLAPSGDFSPMKILVFQRSAG